MKRMARRSGKFSRLKDSSGQVLALYVVALVALLGLAGLVVDVGHAFFVKRSLQAAADAAATAGASELPDPGAATATAQAYSGSSGGANERDNISGVQTTVSTKCLSIAPCHPVNAVVVEQSTKVNTFFARVLGIDSFDVSARATACSPCSAKPLDVMLVLDRTTSMCRGGNCSKLNNARAGIKTFLTFMDPEQDRVGLSVFPPALGDRCGPTPTSNYDDPSAIYVVAPLSNDYSALTSTLDCLQPGQRTSYANAFEAAQAQLSAAGRGGVADVIIFLSDGRANYGPAYYPDSSPYRIRPCAQAVSSAAAAKASGTEIFTIGYDLSGKLCQGFDWSTEQPPISSVAAISAMASAPDMFYEQPNAGELNTLYTRIASQLTGSRLVDNGLS